MNAARTGALAVLGSGLAASALLILVIAWLAPVAVGAEAMAFERELLSWFQRWPEAGMGRILREAGQLGEGVVLFLLVAVLAMVLWRPHRRHALILVAAYGGSFAIHWTGKLLVGRPRPRLIEWSDHLASGTSYPSGHAVEAAATYMALAWILTRVAPRVPALAVWVSAVILVLLNGISRLYLGLHWPSDVLAGWTAGLLWAGTCIFAASRHG